MEKSSWCSDSSVVALVTDDAFTADRGVASSPAVIIVVDLLRKMEILFKELNCMHERAMTDATKTAILCLPYPEIFRPFDGKLAELISIKMWVQSVLVHWSSC
jgi:hypothetical protein